MAIDLTKLLPPIARQLAKRREAAGKDKRQFQRIKIDELNEMSESDLRERLKEFKKHKDRRPTYVKVLDWIDVPRNLIANAIASVVGVEKEKLRPGTFLKKVYASDILGKLGWKPKTTAGKVGRGVVGFLGDVALDPLTYLTAGAVTGMRISKAMPKLVGRGPQIVKQAGAAAAVGRKITPALTEAAKAAGTSAKALTKVGTRFRSQLAARGLAGAKLDRAVRKAVTSQLLKRMRAVGEGLRGAKGLKAMARFVTKYGEKGRTLLRMPFAKKGLELPWGTRAKMFKQFAAGAPEVLKTGLARAAAERGAAGLVTATGREVARTGQAIEKGAAAEAAVTKVTRLERKLGRLKSLEKAPYAKTEAGIALSRRVTALQQKGHIDPQMAKSLRRIIRKGGREKELAARLGVELPTTVPPPAAAAPGAGVGGVEAVQREIAKAMGAVEPRLRAATDVKAFAAARAKLGAEAAERAGLAKEAAGTAAEAAQATLMGRLTVPPDVATAAVAKQMFGAPPTGPFAGVRRWFRQKFGQPPSEMHTRMVGVRRAIEQGATPEVRRALEQFTKEARTVFREIAKNTGRTVQQVEDQFRTLIQLGDIGENIPKIPTRFQAQAMEEIAGARELLRADPRFQELVERFKGPLAEGFEAEKLGRAARDLPDIEAAALGQYPSVLTRRAGKAHYQQLQRGPMPFVPQRKQLQEFRRAAEPGQEFITLPGQGAGVTRHPVGAAPPGLSPEQISEQLSLGGEIGFSTMERAGWSEQLGFKAYEEALGVTGTARRWAGLSLPKAQRGRGLGQEMMLDTLAQLKPTEWAYNTQFSTSASAALKRLSDKGLVEVYTHGRRGQVVPGLLLSPADAGPAGLSGAGSLEGRSFIARLTDKGRGVSRGEDVTEALIGGEKFMPEAVKTRAQVLKETGWEKAGRPGEMPGFGYERLAEEGAPALEQFFPPGHEMAGRMLSTEAGEALGAGVRKHGHRIAAMEGMDLANKYSVSTKDVLNPMTAFPGMERIDVPAKNVLREILEPLVRDRMYPPSVAGELRGMMEVWERPGALLRISDFAYSTWKALALIHPAYTFRNFGQGIVGGLMAGVPRHWLKRMGDSEGRMLTAALVDGITPPPGAMVHFGATAVPAREAAMLFRGVNVAQAGFTSQIQMSQLGLFNMSDVIRKGYGWFFRLNNKMESQMRVGMMLALMDDGMDLGSAAQRMIRAMPDMTDITLFERNVMRRIMPWYSWFRRNSANQLHFLVNKPAYFAGAEKLRHALQQVLVGDQMVPEELRPDWQQEQQALQFMGDSDQGHMFLLASWLPFQDLSKIAMGTMSLQDGARAAVEQMRPEVKLLAEMSTGHDIFRRREIMDVGAPGAILNVIPALAGMSGTPLDNLLAIRGVREIRRIKEMEGVGPRISRAFLGGAVQRATRERGLAALRQKLNARAMKLRSELNRALEARDMPLADKIRQEWLKVQVELTQRGVKGPAKATTKMLERHGVTAEAR